MDKARHDDPDIADEYDFSNGAPNPYAERLKDGYTIRFVSDEEDRRPEASITRSPDVQGGTPVFAGTRVPVQTLFDYLETDGGLAGFLEQHPTVSRDQAVAVVEDAKRALLTDRA